jgi:hypothetical protein
MDNINPSLLVHILGEMGNTDMTGQAIVQTFDNKP